MKKGISLALVFLCAAACISCAKKKGIIKETEKPVVLENKEQKKPALVEIRFVKQGGGDDQTFAVRETNEFLALEDKVLFSQSDIISADLILDDYGNSAVKVLLTDEASERFAALTGANIGRRMGIVVNGELITAPQIREKIPDGSLVIKGSLTKLEAETIKKSLEK
jgi:preprotein translocase subunit SecD